METLMNPSDSMEPGPGIPVDLSCFEVDLPPFLKESIEAMKEGQAKLARGEKYFDWDCDFCDLHAQYVFCKTCNTFQVQYDQNHFSCSSSYYNSSACIPDNDRDRKSVV